MDNRPIGIFDSGVGGLSAVRVLALEAPQESFVYFGDTARVPYGVRTAEDIKTLSRQDARFLRTHGVKALVIACNTITANAMPEITADNQDIPVIGAIEPSVEQAVKATTSGKIGVIATNATVHSGVYERAIGARLPGVRVTAQSCTKLVPLIEAGHMGADDKLLMPVLWEYLEPLLAADVDTVILGCTHYPLIRQAVQTIMGDGVRLVDSGAASIGTVLSVLEKADRHADPAGKGREAFYCSARRAGFTDVAERFLGRSIESVTEEIDIETY